MVIGFDGSRSFASRRTGTENYSYQLLKALAKIDEVNQYIVYLRPDFRQKDIQEFPNNFKFQISNFKFLWTQAGLALQTFKDKLDVLFVPAHTLPVIRKPGLKTVVTVHDLGSEYLSSMHQFKQRLYLSIMEKNQLKTATKIIVVSKATKDDLIKRVGIEPDKIAVIYEGYDKELFKPIKDEALVNSLIHYDLQPKTYYLFVGTVHPRKNLKRLIQAFANLVSKGDTFRAYNLVIVGAKGWLSDEIYQMPKKLGIEEKVKFLGYVPEEDLPALYSGTIALVFPSLFEGFGLPILEAQACGCPVITSNLSAMPEVAGYVRVNRNVAGKGAILVDPYDVEDIVRGIRETLPAGRQVRGIREKLIKAGFGNIKKFSWEKTARETLAIL